jgi:hypothetical protein
MLLPGTQSKLPILTPCKSLPLFREDFIIGTFSKERVAMFIEIA